MTNFSALHDKFAYIYNTALTTLLYNYCIPNSLFVKGLTE